MIKIKNKSTNATILNIALLILSIVVGIINNNNCEFIFVTITLCFIIKKAKVSYFSIFSFIMWFGFLQEYFASIDISLSSGRLMWDASVPIYIFELYVCMMILFLLELIMFNRTDVLEAEKGLYEKRIPIKKRMAYLYASGALVLVLLAYPSLPSFYSVLARDMGFISSSLVVPITILLLSITYDYLKKSFYIKIVTLITLLWILLHGDRVIVLGFIVYCLLKYMNNKDFKLDSMKSLIFNKRIYWILLGLIIVIILNIRVQNTRMNVAFTLNKDVWFSILKQGTAADVVHAFNCSVDMWQNGNGVYGFSYLYYISNMLPSANQEYYSAVGIIEKYPMANGGGLFFSEPMMNGGLLLCFIHTFIFLLVLLWIFSKKNDYHSYLMIPFVILIFRFAWYASCAGVVKMVMYYVPAAYLLGKRLKI